MVALLRQLIQYSKDLSDTVRTERGREVDHEFEELSFYFAALRGKDSISEGDCGSERGPMLTGRNAGSHVCVVECARKYQVITPGALSVLPKVPGRCLEPCKGSSITDFSAQDCRLEMVVSRMDSG